MEAQTFEHVDAEAARSTPAPANSLRKGGYVCIDGAAHKVLELKKAKTGKHGHAKIRIVGVDMLSGARHETIVSSSHSVDVPVVCSNEFMIMYVGADRFVSLMTADGETRPSLQLPENEVGEAALRHMAEIEEAGGDQVVVITVQSVMGEEQVTGVKVCADW